MILKQKGMTNDSSEALTLLKPGMELYGFLGGLFGRDSYGVKTIVMVDAARGYIYATENGLGIGSRHIDNDVYTWAGIVEYSNQALEDEEHED